MLDLFSGIGGFSLGLENTGAFETVAFCEIEDYPRRVLKKHWPDVPIASDIRKLKYGEAYGKWTIWEKDEIQSGEGKIDVVCGGFPCQPYSIAG